MATSDIRGTDRSALVGDAYKIHFQNHSNPIHAIAMAAERQRQFKEAQNAKNYSDAMKGDFEAPHEFFAQDTQDKIRQFGNDFQKQVALNGGTVTKDMVMRAQQKRSEINMMAKNSRQLDKRINEQKQTITNLKPDEYNRGAALEELGARTANAQSLGLHLTPSLDEATKLINVDPYAYYNKDGHLASQIKDQFPESGMQVMSDPTGLQKTTYSQKGRLGLLKQMEIGKNPDGTPIMAAQTDRNGQLQVTDNPNVLDAFDSHPAYKRHNDERVLDAMNKVYGNKFQTIEQANNFREGGVAPAQDLRKQLMRTDLAKHLGLDIKSSVDRMAPKEPSSSGGKGVVANVAPFGESTENMNFPMTKNGEVIPDQYHQEQVWSPAGVTLSTNQRNDLKAQVNPKNLIDVHTGRNIPNIGEKNIIFNTSKLLPVTKAGNLIKTSSEKEFLDKAGNGKNNYGGFKEFLSGVAVDKAGEQEFLSKYNELNPTQQKADAGELMYKIMSGEDVGKVPPMYNKIVHTFKVPVDDAMRNVTKLNHPAIIKHFNTAKAKYANIKPVKQTVKAQTKIAIPKVDKELQKGL